MKRALTAIGFTAACLVGTAASAERLEVALSVAPAWVSDEHYEAFSADNLMSGRFGLDLRTEVANLSGFKLIPLFNYRFFRDGGFIYDELDTSLKTHDFALGLRVRKGVLTWMALFAEVTGGVLLASMDASLSYGDDYGGDIDYESDYESDVEPLLDYEDRALTWSVGALLGAEFTLSRTWLRSRGITRFCFGGEIAGGYIRRGDLSFDPTLESGGDNALGADTVGPWGEVNLSGGVFQIAVDFYFF
jgi:hypothetical protein